MRFMTSAGKQDIYTRIFKGVPKEVVEAILNDSDMKKEIDFFIDNMESEGYKEEDLDKGKVTISRDTKTGIETGQAILPLDMGKIFFVEQDELYYGLKDIIWRIISQVDFPIAEEFIDVDTLLNDAMSDFNDSYTAKEVEGQGQKLLPDYFEGDVQLKTKNYFIDCSLY